MALKLEWKYADQKNRYENLMIKKCLVFMLKFMFNFCYAYHLCTRDQKKFYPLVTKQFINAIACERMIDEVECLN